MLRLFILLFFFAITVFANEKVVLQLKWLHQFQFAGYYAAKEKGFYADAGLDVEIRERNLRYNNIEQVIRGEAQYGVSDSVILLYKARHEPVVIVAPIFQHSPGVLLTLKSSGIDTPYKLKNRQLTFYEKDTDGLAILSMLQSLDVHPDINRIRDKTDYTLLMNHQTDAYACYLTNEPFYFKEKGIAVNIINPANYGVDYYGDMLFTSTEEAQQHPERVRRFKAATLKGWRYALEHKEEIIALIQKKYATLKSLEHLRYEADALDEMIQHRSLPIGTLDTGRISFILKHYEKAGLLENTIPIDEYIFEPFQTPNHLTKEQQEYLEKKGHITMCIDPDWMPFEKNDNGRHIGMSADYIALLQNEINTPIQMIPTATWSESLQYGKERKCDIFSLVMPTEERRTYLDFTIPYFRTPLIITTRLDELFIDDITKILDKKIGVVKNYAYTEILKKRYPNMMFIEVDNINDGLRRVANKELFGMIDTLATAGYHIQKEYSGQLKIAGKFDETWDLGIGTRNDEPLLLEIFNQAINNIPAQKKQNIFNQWISIKYDKNTDYKTILQWFGGLVLIFITILLIIMRSNRLLSHEITRRQEAEEKLQRYIDLVDKNIITSTTDIHGNITNSSQAFYTITGYNEEEILGQKPLFFQHPDVSKKTRNSIKLHLYNNHAWDGELQILSKSGRSIWVQTHISPLCDELGNRTGYTAIMQDITSEKLLETLSITDALTELYNRRYFNIALPRVINSSKRSNTLMTLVILDIDYFKRYNDTYGHLAGDHALQSIAFTIKKTFNRADDYCFRIGGEEFAIVLQDMAPDKVLQLIESLRNNIEALKILHDKNSTGPYVTASFGVLIKRSERIINIDRFYQETDELLYQAKSEGRNRIVYRIDDETL